MSGQSQNHRVSLRTISEMANVTPSTASRILNESPGYKYADDTVRRVTDAAKQLGYRTNRVCQSAFTGTTRSVGVVLPLGNFYGTVAQGIHDRLLKEDYAMVMGLNNKDYDDPENSAEKRIIHRLNQHLVDGFILRPTADHAADDHFREIIELKLPLITIDREVESPYADFVGTDNVAGGRLVAAHLAELGHTTIIHLVGNQSVSSFRERASGFEDAIIDHDCTLHTVFLKPNLEDLKKTCTKLLSRPERPTAVACPTDSDAFRVVRILTEMGLRVPDDVSVIGFGNLDHLHASRPLVTTVNQRPDQIGTKAVELFLARRDEDLADPADHQKQSVRVGVELVKGESCRPLSSV